MEQFWQDLVTALVYSNEADDPHGVLFVPTPHGSSIQYFYRGTNPDKNIAAYAVLSDEIAYVMARSLDRYILSVTDPHTLAEGIGYHKLHSDETGTFFVIVDEVANMIYCCKLMDLLVYLARLQAIGVDSSVRQLDIAIIDGKNSVEELVQALEQDPIDQQDFKDLVSTIRTNR